MLCRNSAIPSNLLFPISLGDSSPVFSQTALHFAITSSRTSDQRDIRGGRPPGNLLQSQGICPPLCIPPSSPYMFDGWNASSHLRPWGPVNGRGVHWWSLGPFQLPTAPGPAALPPLRHLSHEVGISSHLWKLPFYTDVNGHCDPAEGPLEEAELPPHGVSADPKASLHCFFYLLLTREISFLSLSLPIHTTGGKVFCKCFTRLLRAMNTIQFYEI